MSKDAIKEKLKKLLAIAKDDNASANEIENSLKIAAKLMRSYHLSEEDLTDDQEDVIAKIEKSQIKNVKTYVGGKKFLWETRLLSYIEKLIDGIVVYTGHKELKRTPSGLLINGGETGVSFHFCGVAEDVEIAKQLFDELRCVIIALARMKYESVFKGDGAEYAEGFVIGLMQQIVVEQKKIECEESNSNRGLILVQKRQELIKKKISLTENHLKSTNVSLKKSSKLKGGNSKSDFAFNDGLKDGNEYDISLNRRKKIC